MFSGREEVLAKFVVPLPKYEGLKNFLKSWKNKENHDSYNKNDDVIKTATWRTQ